MINETYFPVMSHKTGFGVSCPSFVLTSSLCLLLSRVKKNSASDNDGRQGWYSVSVPPRSGTRMQVGNLSPNTDYQFSILAQNKMGTGPFSAIVNARTLGQYSELSDCFSSPLKPLRTFGGRVRGINAALHLFS